jgi:23S rRNA (uracil1939-C5)-methyltransferase
MARRTKQKNKILEGVLLTSIADKGQTVGRHGEKVVFVQGGVPGDVVDVRVQKSYSNREHGVVHRLVKPSEDRIAAFCSHFGTCGGCKWQHLAYEAQLRHKETVVVDAFERIAKVDVGEFLPIVGANPTQYYRNKLEFAFSDRRWLTEEEVQSGDAFVNRNALGFHLPEAFDRIVDVTHCYLQPDPSNDIRNVLRAYALEHGYSFYNVRNRTGLLRQLLIRTATTGQTMVLVAFAYDDPSAREAILGHLQQQVSGITSLLYVINDKANDTIYDLDVHTFWGAGFIVEQLGHVQFKIGPKSFFQTNSRQAAVLYGIAADFAQLTGTENVYDLYTGLGSIACYVAHRCKQVVGIEEVPAAIDDARENAVLNGLENTTFYAGDVKQILTAELVQKHGAPDLIITDPPRVGMHPDVVNTLLDIAAPRIVYVSCNPATQARDLQLLSVKYRVLRVQPVDMFPHTHHIESVALLALR